MRPLRAHLITDEELIEASRQALEAAGVGNWVHSLYLSSISEHVVGSDNPVFCQLQPFLQRPTARVWLKAYAVALDYLSQNDLKVTRSTILSELNCAQIPFQAPPPDSVGTDVSQLIQSAPQKLSLKQRAHQSGLTRTQKKRAGKPGARGKGSTQTVTPRDSQGDSTLNTFQDWSDDDDVVIDQVVDGRGNKVSLH
jgi:hypothetical protein